MSHHPSSSSTAQPSHQSPSPERPLFELCANGLESAIAADEGGADRIELCIALQVGGLTPPIDLIAQVQERITIPNHVLIRSRAGDFVYTKAEGNMMLEQIAACRELGVAGVVIGALTPEGNLDVALTTAMIEAAGPLHVTFHRAFDQIRQAEASLEQLITLGVGRILTSGTRGTVVEGVESLRTLVHQAGDRIRVMPGGGVRLDNIRELHRRVNARDYHASLLRPGADATRVEDVRAFVDAVANMRH